MRAVIVCLAILAFPAFAAAGEKTDLVIEISAQKEIYPDEVVAPKVVIRNTGKNDAYIVRAIDGSFDGLRSVVDYKWVVKKGADRVGRRTDIVRIDAQVNALQDEDVLLVKAGKEVDPQANGFGRFESYHDLRVPGKYTIAVRYELNPVGTEKGSDTALKLIQKQPAVLIESKAVEVTVLPFPPAVAAAADKVKAAEARAQVVRQFAEVVAKNQNATAQERDDASARLKRADAVLAEVTADHAAKLAEFQKKRAEKRKKK